MVHLPRLQAPNSARVVVPGPGPAERHGDSEAPAAGPVRTGTLIEEGNTAPPTQPALPPRPAAAAVPSVEGSEKDDEAGDGSDHDDEPASAAQKRNDDPYSNLDSAFSNYLADEPRPMGAGRNDDDLLF